MGGDNEDLQMLSSKGVETICFISFKESCGASSSLSEVFELSVSELSLCGGCGGASDG